MDSERKIGFPGRKAAEEAGKGTTDALIQTIMLQIQNKTGSEIGTDLFDDNDVMLYEELLAHVDRRYPGLREDMPEELKHDIAHIQKSLEDSPNTKGAMAVLAAKRSR